MLKKLKKISIHFSISNELILYSLGILFAFYILLYMLIPVLLNFPPETINTSFENDISFICYKYQTLIIFFTIVTFIIVYIKYCLRYIDRWWKNHKTDTNKLLLLRKKALSFPYSLYAFIEFIPSIITLIILLIGNCPSICIFKILTIIFSFSTLIASIIFIISKKILYRVLVKTSRYIDIDENAKPISLKTKLIFQLFPSVLVVVLISSLFGYYSLTYEKGNILNTYYTNTLVSEANNISDNLDINNINNILSKYYLSDSTFSFIQLPDNSIVTSNNTNLSTFFIKYMNELSDENNIVYDSYCTDCQAVIKHITYNNENYIIGIYYQVNTFNYFAILLILSFILFIFNMIIIFYVSSSLSKDIKNINKGLEHIINHDTIDEKSKLPITSSDELGELVIALNQLQDLTSKQFEEIKDNQEKLMERERLASLGQLIGGIAHNLKTPIMSIAGALEGLKDLINEYNCSIEDPEVNYNDHHEIASEMSTWIDKIKNYTEYMSDIITAVKGQAIVMSDKESYIFTIDELVKRVNILMKHELKNALINLNTDIKVENSTELRGNVNSLVQVINNMISNSIQAYNGKQNENIELTIYKESEDSSNIIISVKDYAGGLPKEIVNRLFKEMVTTKGKNGTGLGLFMSYSNIKAHFNGTITFDSKPGIGCEFKIIIPM